MSQSIVCSDDRSIILRGTCDTKLVTYLQEWVSTKATPFTVQGMLLSVDKSCTVAVQSANQAGCSVSSSAKQSGLSSSATLGVAVGVAFVGGVAIVGVILGAIFAIRKQVIMKRKNSV